MTDIVRSRGHAEIDLGWSAPPLSLNDRLHWAARAKITALIRRDVAWLAKAAHLPTGRAHATVALHWRPRDNRIRDAENPAPTLKAACDALVDHGLVVDDDPAHMTKHMPVIHPAVKGAPSRMWLEVDWDPGAPAEPP